MTQVDVSRMIPTTGETAAIVGARPARPRTIGLSDLTVFPLAMSGNVFGWTADDATSSTRPTRTRRAAARS